MTEFRPSGSVDGIPLVEHDCPRFSGAVFVSPQPSAQDELIYIVPMCGCRP